MGCKWNQEPLREFVSDLFKGVVPIYIDEGHEYAVPVIGQRCVRNYEIDLSPIRFHNGFSKPIPIRKMLRKHDILINATGVGSAGRVAQIRDDIRATIDGHVIVVRAKKIDPMYLGYALKCQQSKIEQLAEGSTGQTEMNKQRLQDEIIISYPNSIVDQLKIVHILNSIDRQIVFLNQVNGHLSECIHAIYRNFANEVQVGNNGHEGTISELLEVRYGKDHKKLANGTIPVYGSGGLMRHVDRSLYQGESVLVPRKGSLDHVMYVNESFWTVDTMFYTVPRMIGAAKYAYEYLLEQNLAAMNAGSAVPSMTTRILNAIPVFIPPESALNNFDSITEVFFKSLRRNFNEIDALAQLRDALLPKLMSGEIDVSKVELPMPPAQTPTSANGRLPELDS
ncbi:restriction endonuclease subunit S [Bifidobacterium sp. SO4]|uniref:restriction endonuclease subunit S n=1 Tax=Bifidobacterium sp. SO4 TaxID=2809030 RepID=UPI001BDCF4AC|nr:restriction endonuclease subunit S [Bifidobacterium sp. SO4]MBT1170436.1 restriction endonuclease subunit S [Bifidobacterium sp. SO4]